MLEKPMIIFTTFWDAVSLVDLGGIIIDDKIIEFDRCEVNVCSIALAQPKIQNQIAFPELDFFAPTWDLLKSYKSDKNWTSYTKDYKGLIKEYQKRVAIWLNGLDKGKIHILCCWENTCNGANCHRRILYDLLSKSKRTKDVASYIYRDGDSKTFNKDKKLIAFKKTFNGELAPEPSLNINEEIERLCGESDSSGIWGTIRIGGVVYILEVVLLTAFFKFKVFYGSTSNLDPQVVASLVRNTAIENYEIFFDPLHHPVLADLHLVAKKSGRANTEYDENYGRSFIGFQVREIKEL